MNTSYTSEYYIDKMNRGSTDYTILISPVKEFEAIKDDLMIDVNHIPSDGPIKLNNKTINPIDSSNIFFKRSDIMSLKSSYKKSYIADAFDYKIDLKDYKFRSIKYLIGYSYMINKGADTVTLKFYLKDKEGEHSWKKS